MLMRNVAILMRNVAILMRNVAMLMRNIVMLMRNIAILMKNIAILMRIQPTESRSTKYKTQTLDIQQIATHIIRTYAKS